MSELCASVSKVDAMADTSQTTEEGTGALISAKPRPVPSTDKAKSADVPATGEST